MSIRRLLATALGMSAVALALLTVAPTPSATWAALAAPQQTVDTSGVDGLLLPIAGLLAWLAWAWGTLGLTLTAAAALPGALGWAARAAQRAVVPESGRRVAALVLGVGLGVGAPTAAGATPSTPVPDWPVVAGTPTAGSTAPPPAPPDRPAATPGGTHVVTTGECLWLIAGQRLAATHSAQPTDAQIAGAVTTWWTRNRDVVGPDPDLILPGQLLQAPDP